MGSIGWTEQHGAFDGVARFRGKVGRACTVVEAVERREEVLRKGECVRSIQGLGFCKEGTWALCCWRVREGTVLPGAPPNVLPCA